MNYWEKAGMPQGIEGFDPISLRQVLSINTINTMTFSEQSGGIRTGKYLLVPIPKNPYFRIGPQEWQDWHRQVQRKVAIARDLKTQDNKVEIVILSNFQLKGKLSEIEVYTKAFHILAPELEVRSYKETNDTLGQVEKSFELRDEMDAKLVFITAWMQYPRVLYLAH